MQVVVAITMAMNISRNHDARSTQKGLTLAKAAERSIGICKKLRSTEWKWIVGVKWTFYFGCKNSSRSSEVAKSNRKNVPIFEIETESKEFATSTADTGFKERLELSSKRTT